MSAVLVRVMLSRFTRMMSSVLTVPMRDLGMMCRLLVISAFLMFRSLTMVFRRVLVMFRRFTVVLCAFM